MSDPKSVKIEFTLETLITVTVFILSLFFLWSVKQVLAIIFLSFIIMSALYPAVKWLESKKLPKALSIGLIYSFGIASILGLVILIFVPLIGQVIELFENLPAYVIALVDKLGPIRDWYFSNEIDKELVKMSGELASYLVGTSESLFQVFKQAWSAVGIMFAIFSTVILSLYMMVEHDRAIKGLLTITPVRDRVKALKIVNAIEEQLGKWLRGQMLLSVVVGALVWITLTLLQVEFALPLAILAGLLESVPNIGPIIAMIPAWLIAVGTGGTVQIIGVPLAYIIIQQLENNIIVPQIVKKTVGLNPVITMVAFLIGAELAGIVGALLAIPVAAVIQILLLEIQKK